MIKLYVRTRDASIFAEVFESLAFLIELPLGQSPCEWLTQEECIERELYALLSCTNFDELRALHEGGETLFPEGGHED